MVRAWNGIWKAVHAAVQTLKQDVASHGLLEGRDRTETSHEPSTQGFTMTTVSTISLM